MSNDNETTEVLSNINGEMAVLLLAMVIQKYGNDDTIVLSEKAILALPPRLEMLSEVDDDTKLVTITVKEVNKDA